MRRSKLTFFFLVVYFEWILADCFVGTLSPVEIPKAAKVQAYLDSLTNKQRNLSYCEWYNELTCCTKDPTYLQDEGFFGSCKLSENCQEWITLYQCKYCSPL